MAQDTVSAVAEIEAREGLTASQALIRLLGHREWAAASDLADDSDVFALLPGCVASSYEPFEQADAEIALLREEIHGRQCDPANDDYDRRQLFLLRVLLDRMLRARKFLAASRTGTRAWERAYFQTLDA